MDFEHQGKTYHNPVEFALAQIGGTWKTPILWRLHKNTMRYGELRKSMHKVTHKMLTQQLRELEADGYLHRRVYAEVPPRVEYSLTEKGQAVMPVVKALRNWGLELMRDAGIEKGPEQKENHQ
ncbi:MAG: helix-turn-helix domain-containing protein [Saprospiraceae bacterium]